MSRLAVNQENVSSYISRTLSANNQHLLYGLTLLPRALWAQIMDGLINYEISVEDLIRLGSFTKSEAEAFIWQNLWNWSNPALANPVIGTTGYAYLDELGLLPLLNQAAAGQTSRLSLQIATNEVQVGGVYPTRASIIASFEDDVLPIALDGNDLSSLFPVSAGEINALCPTEAVLFTYIFGAIFTPFSEVTEANAATAILNIPPDLGILASHPGLSHWLLAEPRPSSMTHLLYHREAADRNVSGEHDLASLTSIVETLEASQINIAATTVLASKFDFNLALAKAVSTHLGGTALDSRIASLETANTAIYAYRDALRIFVLSAFEQSSRRFPGFYAP
jgi:hypothetical protein